MINGTKTKMPQDIECRHLHAIIRGADPVMSAFCPTCQGPVPLTEVLSNWLNELAGIRKDQLACAKEMQDILGYMRKLSEAIEERVKI